MRQPFLRFLVYLVVLYASFAHNVFWVPDGAYTIRDGFRSGYAGYDSDLVMNRLGLTSSVSPIYPLYWWDYESHRGGFTYQSQFGPQGMVLGPIYQAVGGDVEEFAGWAASGSAFLTAAVLALFFASIARRLGPTAADAAALLTACTPVLLPFATSLYWACFLLLAPFVAVWMLYPRCLGSPARFASLLALVSILTALKCLCGYEYISTVAISPTAAIVYHRLALRDRWRRIVGPALLAAAAGGVGFFGAVGMHVLQLKEVAGADGLAVIRERAEGNTLGKYSCIPAAGSCIAPDPKFLPAELRARVRCLINYFWLPAVATPVTWGPFRGFATLGAVVLASAAAGFLAWRKRAVCPEAAALVPAVAVGLLGAAAWHFVAITHSCIHMHLNSICYAVPFLPLAYTLFGWALGQLGERVPAVRFLPAAAAIAAIIVNVAVSQTRVPEEELEARAEARVGAVLRGEASASSTPSFFVRPPLTMGEAPRRLASEPWFHCRLRPDFNGSGAPTRVISGVIVCGPARDARPTCRIVAVAGGRILPAQTSYERVLIHERINRGRTSCTSFVVAVAEGEIETAGPLRLYAVFGEDFENVAEIVSPIQNP